MPTHKPYLFEKKDTYVYWCCAFHQEELYRDGNTIIKELDWYSENEHLKRKSNDKKEYPSISFNYKAPQKD